VLQARYFKEGQFLDAKRPKNASYTWKSILFGRDLLSEGLIWRVGNGRNILVCDDNWIPRPSIQHPLGFLPEATAERVEDLLLPDGRGWNEQKLRATFYEADVSDILKIHVRRAGTEDYIAWNYTKNGIFSVRSAYHLKMQLNQLRAGRPSASLSSGEHRGWLALWSADVPGKVKVHCWRLARNGLAVGQELHRQKIKEGVKCVVCKRDETLVHRFWTCPHSARVWDLLREQTGRHLDFSPSHVLSQRDLQGWLFERFGCMNERELGLTLMVIYQLWLARNEARDAAQIEDPVCTARRAFFLLEEWGNIRTTPSGCPPRRVEHWLLPAPGWTKINADGASIQDSGHGGCGVVFRDYHGGFLRGVCHLFPSVADAGQAELLACRQGLEVAKELGLGKVLLETDCSTVVSKLQCEEKDRSIHGHLVEEIKVLLRDFAEVGVRHASRSCNGAAHSLAKDGCVNKLCKTWVGVPPGYLVDILASDSSGF
jgi:ribonuclease HI